MSLMSLAFALIDSDGNGVIDADETAEFFADLRVSGMGRDRNVNWAQLGVDLAAARNASEAASASLRGAGDGKKRREVNEQTFCRYALRNPAILYPALHIQDMLREKIGGKAFWAAATERRAGKLESSQVQAMYDQIRLQVQNHMLLQAIVAMMDGFVVAESLAPNGDVERIRDIWSQTFGAGKRALLLGRADSIKALESTPERKKAKKPQGAAKPGGTKLAKMVRGLSAKLIASAAMKKVAKSKGVQPLAN